MKTWKQLRGTAIRFSSPNVILFMVSFEEKILEGIEL